DVVQPVLWAVMVSLAEVWAWFGVRPAAVVGHSQGEIAAAVVAGALSLEDGARIVAVRSQALRALSGRGAMASIAMGQSLVDDVIARLGERAVGVGVAAVNGPSSTVVSGPPEAVAAVVAAAEADGVRARLIDVDYASHGPQVDEITEELIARLGRVVPQESTEVAFYSSVTGARVEASALDAGYWVENLRRPVRFEAAVEAVLADGYRVLIESSPHPVLSVGMQETSERLDVPAVTVPTLQRDQGGPVQLARALGQAFAAGIDVDWKAWFTAPADTAPALVDLPTYAFQRERFWLMPGGWVGVRGGAGEEGFWRAVGEGDVGGVAGVLGLGEEVAEGVLGPVLPVLARWREGVVERELVGGWCYREEWVPVEVSVPAPGSVSGVWVVVVPVGFVGGGVVGVVLGALEGLGVRCVVVEVDVVGGGFEGLVGGLGGVEGWSGVVGVVSVLGLVEDDFPGGGCVSVGLVGSVWLLQVLEGLGFGGRVWCVTQGGVSVGGVGVRPVQAEVWGLGRVAALEFPRRWGGLVDLPVVLDGEVGGVGGVVGGLVGVLGGGGVEDQVALRGGVVLGRRLCRDAGVVAGSGWGVGGGSVLVTGGTGGVGGRVVRWVAGLGAEHVIVAGRRGWLAPGVGELVGELEGLGVSVDVVACDVSVRESVVGLLGRVPVGLPLRGVFHVAGVGDFTPIGDLGVGRLGEVLGAKVGGARWLDELTRGLDLAAFVVFSS
ncbi:acyltransferase domain-containing protein, partial [Streptomyces palmae]|uniref:acyltransferase domain-containing protein n=1 Tax=Streptomyces palmae TaxID=1701085 RepID=UPI0035EB51D3